METIEQAKFFKIMERIAKALEKMAEEQPDDHRKPIIGIRLDNQDN